MRKKLYIIGARGFGRDFTCWCRNTPGFLDKYKLCGYLDDKTDAIDDYGDYPPIVSSVEAFEPKEGDIFFCALGNVAPRKKYIGMMLEKGARFDTFISPDSRIYSTARVGIGCFIWHNVLIAADSKLGDFVVCQSNVLLGHDTKIGDHVVLDTGVSCCGFVEIGNGSALHTGTIVVPNVKIGKSVMVGAGSVVIRDVPDGYSMFGNPARRLLAPSNK